MAQKEVVVSYIVSMAAFEACAICDMNWLLLSLFKNNICLFVDVVGFVSSTSLEGTKEDPAPSFRIVMSSM